MTEREKMLRKALADLHQVRAEFYMYPEDERSIDSTIGTLETLLRAEQKKART